jgi:hypothetical protein
VYTTNGKILIQININKSEEIDYHFETKQKNIEKGKASKTKAKS